MTMPTIQEQDTLDALDSNDILTVVTSNGDKLKVKVSHLIDKDGNVSIDLLEEMIMTANENDAWLPRVH